MSIFSYDGIPSDLISEGKEGSRGILVVQSVTKPIQNKSFIFYPDGNIHTISTIDINGTITLETYTWDSDNNPLTYTVS
ncbi:MAG: hypothetical protein JHC33_01005 [Ignisphaera sp.]|nr:hypothetical protein [Ignisphaera sp.]